MSKDLTTTMFESLDNSLVKSKGTKKYATMSIIGKDDGFTDPRLSRKVSNPSRASQFSINSFHEKPNLPLNRKVKRLSSRSDAEGEDISIDTFLEQKWERKRTHRSPDDNLRKPRRKSNWTCNIHDMNEKQIKLEYTVKKHGLDKL